MNDESNAPTTADEASLYASDPLSQSATETADDVLPPDGDAEACAAGEGDTNFEMPADPNGDSDPAGEGTDPTPEEDGLDKLRGELKALREELNERDAKLKRLERVERDWQEFTELYPEVPMTQISEQVWESVEQGSSLAAAYALAERRQVLHQRLAKQANESNRARSSGALHHAEALEFSPAEVRAMSAREVRENLPKIMRSMQKWK